MERTRRRKLMRADFDGQKSEWKFVAKFLFAISVDKYMIESNN